jgi:hypothetical protein
MSTHESLLEAMHLSPESEVARWMLERGVAPADEETMSQAIHDVYCGMGRSTSSIRSTSGGP